MHGGWFYMFSIDDTLQELDLVSEAVLSAQEHDEERCLKAVIRIVGSGPDAMDAAAQMLARMITTTPRSIGIELHCDNVTDDRIERVEHALRRYLLTVAADGPEFERRAVLDRLCVADDPQQTLFLRYGFLYSLLMFANLAVAQDACTCDDCVTPA